MSKASFVLPLPGRVARSRRPWRLAGDQLVTVETTQDFVGGTLPGCSHHLVEADRQDEVVTGALQEAQTAVVDQPVFDIVARV